MASQPPIYLPMLAKGIDLYYQSLRVHPARRSLGRWLYNIHNYLCIITHHYTKFRASAYLWPTIH